MSPGVPQNQIQFSVFEQTWVMYSPESEAVADEFRPIQPRNSSSHIHARYRTGNASLSIARDQGTHFRRQKAKAPTAKEHI